MWKIALAALAFLLATDALAVPDGCDTMCNRSTCRHPSVSAFCKATCEEQRIRNCASTSPASNAEIKQQSLNLFCGQCNRQSCQKRAFQAACKQMCEAQQVKACVAVNAQ